MWKDFDVPVFHYFFTARSPVFNAMFEHEMEESKKVRTVYSSSYRLSISLIGCMCTAAYWVFIPKILIIIDGNSVLKSS